MDGRRDAAPPATKAGRTRGRKPRPAGKRRQRGARAARMPSGSREPEDLQVRVTRRYALVETHCVSMAERRAAHRVERPGVAACFASSRRTAESRGHRAPGAACSRGGRAITAGARISREGQLLPLVSGIGKGELCLRRAERLAAAGSARGPDVGGNLRPGRISESPSKYGSCAYAQRSPQRRRGAHRAMCRRDVQATGRGRSMRERRGASRPTRRPRGAKGAAGCPTPSCRAHLRAHPTASQPTSSPPPLIGRGWCPSAHRRKRKRRRCAGRAPGQEDGAEVNYRSDKALGMGRRERCAFPGKTWRK